MGRNNPYASHFLDLVGNNVVGPNGIRLQSRVTKPNGEFDRSINDKIEAAWVEWCSLGTATADGMMSFLDLETLAMRTVAQDGECLIRMLPGFDNKFGFALQVLDADQLDHTYNVAPTDRQNEIRMGVEINSWGRPLNFHLWTSHPSDHGRSRERVKVPADQIRHLFIRKRPGQTRAVTWFAPVLLDAKMLAGYQEAELVAARTGAAKMGFFMPKDDGVATAGGGEPIPMEAAPGTFEFGPAGHTLEQFDPQHPSAQFGDFNKAILRSFATGVGVSYNSLANDLEGVNYSSIRAGMLSERDSWKSLQVWLCTHLHRPVYLEWMRWALTTGALDLPTRNVSRWSQHAWLPRGWAWVDPLKDITAGILAVRGGLDSRTRLAGEQGRDYEEILADQAREQDLAEEYEVNVSTETSKASSNSKEEKESARSVDDEEDALVLDFANRLLDEPQHTLNGKH